MSLSVTDDHDESFTLALRPNQTVSVGEAAFPLRSFEPLLLLPSIFAFRCFVFSSVLFCTFRSPTKRLVQWRNVAYSNTIRRVSLSVVDGYDENFTLAPRRNQTVSVCEAAIPLRSSEPFLLARSISLFGVLCFCLFFFLQRSALPQKRLVQWRNVAYSNAIRRVSLSVVDGYDEKFTVAPRRNQTVSVCEAAIPLRSSEPLYLC